MLGKKITVNGVRYEVTANYGGKHLTLSKVDIANIVLSPLQLKMLCDLYVTPGNINIKSDAHFDAFREFINIGVANFDGGLTEMGRDWFKEIRTVTYP